MTRRTSSCLLPLCLLLAVCGAGTLLGADKNGVSPQTISLPSGPGSVQGLGESFQPQLNSGSGSYSVPIQLPKGPAGIAPSLSLQYSTGSGNGCLGLGWKLSGLTMVSRNMDGGLPLYVDAANGVDDDFDGTVDNPEEIDRFSGVDLEELIPLPDATFRNENEGSFARYERTAAGWQARTKGGLLHEFGITSEARIENGNRQFAWLLERTRDLNGNAIEFRYMSHPSSPGQKYCKEVRWSGAPAFYAAVMSYDDIRPDVHADFRSGFEVRTGLRLARIDVIAQGVPASPGALTGDLNEDGEPDSLIRRYVLEYDPQAIQSLLRRVIMFGSDGVTALPPLTFAYTEWRPPNDVASPMIRSSGDPDRGLDSNDVELIDMNRDGLPDLLRATATAHRVHLNLGINANGRLAWNTVGTTVTGAPGVDLGSPLVHLADHNADGAADLIRKVNDNLFQVYFNSGEGTWLPGLTLRNIDSWPQWPFEVSGSRTMDNDHNRMHDVFFTTDNSNRLWMMMPGGRFGRGIPLPVLSDGTQAFSFSNPGTMIADVNGDRITDLAWVQSRQVVYWASCGRGNFDGPIFVPLSDQLSAKEITQADFADVNGDALADLVVVRPATSQNGVHYWLNRGHAGFDSRRVILGLPSVQEGDAIRCVDMNGNGSVDLLISNGGRDSSTREQFLDFVPGVRPNLLRRVENGLGLVTTMDYETSVQQMVRARTAGQAWATTMSISVPVVARITEDDSRGNASVREITYRDPHYDPVKQEFRGFTRTEVKEIGDASAPTKITRYVFDTGAAADCRKGMVLSEEVADTAGSRFERAENTVQHRVLGTSPDGGQVCYAFNEATDMHVFEQTNNPVRLRTEYQYDDFGNLLQENKHGIADQEGDEVSTEKTYAYRPEIWLMDRVSRSSTRDGKGILAAEDLYSYDDRGNLLEHRRWLDLDDRYILAVRNEYDAFGNVIRITDANNHSRSVVYDGLLHAYPVSEIVHLESRDLTAAANYDMVLGTVISSVDFAGAVTAYQYDSLGRLTLQNRPGGARTAYEYNLGNPLSRVITRVSETPKSNETFDTYEYSDGLGRKLGSKIEAEDGQWRFVDAVTFNRRKLENARWLPYFAASPDYEPPNPEMSHHVLGYDAQGRSLQTVNPDGTAMSTVYEPLVQHNHDENDTAGANTPKTLRKDGLGRLVEVTERNGPKEEYHTRYEWNTLGNLTAVIDAQGNTKSMAYDSLKRNVSLSDPDRGIVTYAYDDVGNLLRATDAKGQQIRYAYDSASRLVSEDYVDQGGGPADPVDVRYVYDEPSENVDFGDGEAGTATFTGGRLASVTDLSGEEHRSYDARGNLAWTVKRIRDPLLGLLTSYTTSFTYDIMDRIAQIDYPDGDRCSYAYNSASFLESAGGGPGGQAIVANAAFEPTGQLSSLTHGNGVTTTYTYDTRDRLASLRTASAAAVDLINYSYGYDPVSNITRIDDLRPSKGLNAIREDSPRRNSQMFRYDQLDRLTQVKYSPSGDGVPTHGQIDYSYDKIGNMLSQTTPPAGQSGHINNPDVSLGLMVIGGAAGTENRPGRSPGEPPGPHAITATQAGGVYDYDDNGNMIGLDGAVLTWDFKDRLVRFQKGDIDARYTYDYAGRRISKLVTQDNHTDQSLYVNQHFEYRPNRSPIKYVFNGATRVAQVKDTIDSMRPRLQRLWLFEGWNLLTVAIVTPQTIEELFGQGSRVYEWTGTQYRKVAENALVPVGKALWVEVTGTRVVAAGGLYGSPADSVPVPAGQTLLAWPRLEPFVPSEHLSFAESRIQAHEPQQVHWLLKDPSLPANVADVLHSFPAAGVVWFTAPQETLLLPAANQDRGTMFYHGDHLGSASVLTDSQGALLQEVAYFPFGEVRHSHGQGAMFREPYGFTQKEQDAESDLHYFEARYLAGALSRFVSPDPKFANPGGLSADDLSAYLTQPQKANLYSYVLNNPLKYSDPTGLEDERVFAVGAQVSGGANIAGPLNFFVEAGAGVYFAPDSDKPWHEQVGFYGSLGKGAQVGTPNLSVQAVVSYNDTGLNSFAGTSTEYGGSFGWGPAVGGSFAKSHTGGHTYSISGGAGVGGEGHIAETTTLTVTAGDAGRLVRDSTYMTLEAVGIRRTESSPPPVVGGEVRGSADEVVRSGVYR